jgi:Domain of unknown function (DUF3883)
MPVSRGNDACLNGAGARSVGGCFWNMPLNPSSIATRAKLILAGLFLSKFDEAGLKALGFETFTEAFNVIGYALGGKPASIKNYRDEFDPLFPNPRAGWHQRPLRSHCQKVIDEFGSLDLESFAGLIRSFAGYDENVMGGAITEEAEAPEDSAFARRLITGLAAERYFEAVQGTVPQFNGYSIENTTRIGCGYDFRLRAGNPGDFLAVEVKGLQSRTGSVALTPKEYETAGSMSDRFFLFVVKNFREVPFHDIYQNPIASGLQFARKERVMIQVSWLAAV